MGPLNGAIATVLESTSMVDVSIYLWFLAAAVTWLTRIGGIITGLASVGLMWLTAYQSLPRPCSFGGELCQSGSLYITTPAQAIAWGAFWLALCTGSVVAVGVAKWQHNQNRALNAARLRTYQAQLASQAAEVAA